MARTRALTFASLLLSAAPVPAQILFAPQVDSQVAESSKSITGGDVDGDGFDDVVLLSVGGQPFVHRGDGTGQVGPAQPIGPSVSLASIALADLHGDGDLDLVGAAGQGGKNLFVLTGAGDGTFAITQAHSLDGPTMSGPRVPR